MRHPNLDCIVACARPGARKELMKSTSRISLALAMAAMATSALAACSSSSPTADSASPSMVGGMTDCTDAAVGAAAQQSAEALGPDPDSPWRPSSALTAGPSRRALLAPVRPMPMHRRGLQPRSFSRRRAGSGRRTTRLGSAAVILRRRGLPPTPPARPTSTSPAAQQAPSDTRHRDPDREPREGVARRGRRVEPGNPSTQ